MCAKKEILFVANHLTIGGAQKSLVWALRAIDHEQYHVTLYLRKKRLDLLSEIPSAVTVIANEDPTAYYRHPRALWQTLKAKVCRLLGRRAAAERIGTAMEEEIRLKKLAYEAKRYFNGKHYDVAVSYVQGYPAELIATHVEADRKILFYHSSTDEVHSVHERILPCYDTVVAVNCVVRDMLAETYPGVADRLDVLENYVDAEAVREAAEAHTMLPHTEKTCLCSCGRMSPVKGFDLAVEAARILKEKGVPFVWYLVGDGPLRSELEDQVRTYGLEDQVVFAGMQSNPYPWIAGCDIYVQPSYEEAHPLTVMEALILCRPVVTTATTGGRHMVLQERYGLVVDINAAGLADGVERMVRDRELWERVRGELTQMDHSRDLDIYQSKWTTLLGGDGV